MAKNTGEPRDKPNCVHPANQQGQENTVGKPCPSLSSVACRGLVASQSGETRIWEKQKELHGLPRLQGNKLGEVTARQLQLDCL